MTGDDDRTALRRKQEENREAVDRLDRDSTMSEPERKRFFTDVYAQADGNPAMVPWADLEPKPELTEWLAAHPGDGSATAIDVGCGLGDNAAALAEAGYVATGFDLSSDAVDWARRRFSQLSVRFVAADLFALPPEWAGAFDVVHECYTLQALPPEMLDRTAAAIASLVRPGGALLVYARCREDGAPVSGPPWPLEHSRLNVFAGLGFVLEHDRLFATQRGERFVPHSFAVWRRP